MQDQEKHYVEIENEEPGTDMFGKLLEDRDNRVVVSYSFEQQDKERDEYVRRNDMFDFEEVSHSCL